MRKNAENRLDDLVVEGLLARYRQLSFELQKAFLRMGWKSNRKSAPVALQSHFPVYISFGKD